MSFFPPYTLILHNMTVSLNATQRLALCFLTFMPLFEQNILSLTTEQVSFGISQTREWVGPFSSALNGASMRQCHLFATHPLW